jgi:hypothetical protein
MAPIEAVSFASCYVYSPTGKCPVSVRSRLLCEVLKAGDEGFLRRYCERAREQIESSPRFADLFARSTVLIPVPGSAPFSTGRRWVAEELARALAREGLGAAVWAGLRRVQPVGKSATARGGLRPSVAAHYRSFAIENGLVPPAECVLVDDVVTKGRTLLAAAARVHDAFPQARIRGFAMLRTMGLVAEIDRLIEPCVGEIRWHAGDARRRP